MKNKLIKFLGGYTELNDFIENLDTAEKYRLLTLAVKKSFNTIGSDDILKENGVGQWMFQGKPITKATQDLIKAEAQQFLGTTLWRVLQADVQWQANRKMFILAENEVQVVAGKLWTYTLDCLRTRLASLSEGSGLFKNKK